MPCQTSTFFRNPEVPGFIPAMGLVATSLIVAVVACKGWKVLFLVVPKADGVLGVKASVDTVAGSNATAVVTRKDSLMIVMVISVSLSLDAG